MCDKHNMDKDFTDKQFEEEKRASTKRTKNLVNSLHQWFPTGSKFWFNTWRRWMSGDHTSTSIQSIIQDFEDIEGIMLKQNIDDNGDWYPANPQILHWMHKMYISQNAITQISGNINTKTTDKEHNVPHFQYRQYAYDSILQDIEMQYRTPLHRRALMATLNEHIAWKKQNPIHCRNQPNQIPKGKIHSCQTRLPYFGFWRFLEKITFIISPSNNRYTQETSAIIPSTFIFNKKIGLYGIVVDIVSMYWNMKFTRHTHESFDHFVTRILQKIKQISKNKQNANQQLQPVRKLIVLPLIYKYHNCKNILHNHDTRHDHQLYLKIPNNLFTIESYFREIIVNDDLHIANLQISRKAILRDPNTLGNNNCKPYQENIPWQWNYLIVGNQAMSPLNYPPIRDLIENIANGLSEIWPGKAPIDNKMIVHGYQMNCDSFGVIEGTNSLQPYQSIKEHYISPNINHLLTKSLITSFGMTLQTGHWDNLPFYQMYIEDVVRGALKGIKVPWQADVDDERENNIEVCVFFGCLFFRVLIV